MKFTSVMVVAGIAILIATAAFAFNAPQFLFDMGGPGSGDGELSLQVGQLDVGPQGSVFVADRNRLMVYDASGHFVRSWGWGVQDGTPTLQVCTSGCQAGLPGTGTGQFNVILGVAVDSGSNVYVVDLSSRIQKFSSSGGLITSWGQFGFGDGQLSQVTEMSFGPDGNLYVADAWLSRVQVFDPTGAFLGKFGQHGVAEGNFFGDVEGLAVAPNGDIYILDTGSRIHRYDSGGNFILMWGWGVRTGAPLLETCTTGCGLGISGSGPGQLLFGATQSLAIGADGLIYQSHPVAHRVQVFDETGQLQGEWGSLGSSPGEFDFPAAVASSPDGRIYVTDKRNRRVQVFGAPGLADRVQDLLDTLIISPPADEKDVRRVGKAIEHLAKSLDAELWLDGNTLTEEGKRFFDQERQAVHELMKVETVDMTVIIQSLLGVAADLSQSQLEAAIMGNGDPKEIARAQRAMARVQEELDRGRFDHAVDTYKKVWEHARMALE